jgi:hypothetical protein
LCGCACDDLGVSSMSRGRTVALWIVAYIGTVAISFAVNMWWQSTGWLHSALSGAFTATCGFGAVVAYTIWQHRLRRKTGSPPQ